MVYVGKDSAGQRWFPKSPFFLIFVDTRALPRPPRALPGIRPSGRPTSAQTDASRDMFTRAKAVLACARTGERRLDLAPNH